jgi:hypothetical protein
MKVLQSSRWEAAFQRSLRHVHGNTERTEGRSEGGCTDRTKWSSERNLIGMSSSGRRLTGSKET